MIKINPKYANIEVIMKITIKNEINKFKLSFLKILFKKDILIN